MFGNLRHIKRVPIAIAQLVQGNIILAYIRYVLFREDCLPGTLRFAHGTVNALFRRNIKHIWKLFADLFRLIETVHRANGDASRIYTVPAEPGNHECHIMSFSSEVFGSRTIAQYGMFNPACFAD
jgi:hypothetical protein